MHTITIDVYFCYGHRLLKHHGKCKNLHGHSVKLSVSIAQEELNEQDMVCDFFELKARVDAYVNEQLDHNLILHKSDPIIPALKAQNERFLAIAEHPTVEVLSKMIYQHLKHTGLNVEQVVLWETANTNASYREPSTCT